MYSSLISFSLLFANLLSSVNSVWTCKIFQYFDAIDTLVIAALHFARIGLSRNCTYFCTELEFVAGIFL